MRQMKQSLTTAAAILLALPALAQDDSGRAETMAADRQPTDLFADDTITGEEGHEVYGAVCAGCHMPDGQGAVGAGNYPALAGNPNLEFASYPIYIIVNGQGNMPPLGPVMSDEQVVAVTEYIQTSFGNDYEPDATIEAVQTARPADPDATTGEH
ncbi:Cytochrome C oxidase, cbb3-type, subunit III [Palleronia marisminoris]|uniref:Fructose dehydrogenase cytochrome subunit n=2 Tax=Palleronia marisminoris TaxID=315423 RepID=A0A1Y5S142_9RHOB|nr:Cytochrome C oxidase, cbb3-type, subunit III [Palleronia marisminoris]SLN29227.1 Fructose dehydrogenase cytochrome subunit precursor [Palleronia marisminoris]